MPKINARERDSFSLIQTKLQPPRVSSGLVERPILINRLNEGLERKLTLVAAPAGFGKTTLVVDWLGQVERPYAWLSLDRSDNDPALFLNYFVAAIQSCFPGSCAGTSQLLLSAGLANTEKLATSLLNDLSALPGNFILVLDDYQLIQESKIQQLVGLLLERIPDSLHLVIISRADPLLPLPRLRAQQQLLEIRTNSLRFNDGEAWQILQLGAVYAVDTATATILNERIEGWAAGLQLASLSMSGASHEQWVESFQQRPNEFITDYLFSEVLNQQPPAMQRFLVGTSILDRFSADLCQSLLEDERVVITQQQIQAIIRELLRTNLFIVPLDARNGWYRYHHLFQQMLQQRLTMERSKIGFEVLHSRAAAWFAEHGYTEEALDHALAANDMDLAVTIVEENSRKFLNGLERRTMERWMATLPEEVVWNRPKLLVTKAWLFYRHWRLNALHDLLNRLDEQLAVAGKFDQGEEPFIRGQMHALRAATSFQLFLDYRQTIAHSKQAVQLLPATEGGSLSTAILHLALALTGLGEKKAAVDYLQEIIHDPAPGGPAKVQARIGLAMVHYVAGDLAQLEQLTGQFLKLTKGNEAASAPASWFMGLLCFDQNRLDEAASYLQTMFNHRHLWNYLGGFFSWWGQIRILQISGLLAEAQENIDDLRVDYTGLQNRPFLLMLEILQAYQHLLEGDETAALRWAAAYQPGKQSDALFPIDTADLIWSRILVTTGDAAERERVLSYLEGQLVPLKETGFSRRKVQLLTHMAAVNIALDQEGAAQDCLREALLLAQPGGMVRSFADAGSALVPYLQRFQKEDFATEFTLQVLATFDEPTSEPSMATATLLTRRELEILQLMQNGLSNKDIAQTLVISIYTVKRHASNIYEKLGVNGRQKALFRARERGILQ